MICAPTSLGQLFQLSPHFVSYFGQIESPADGAFARHLAPGSKKNREGKSVVPAMGGRPLPEPVNTRPAGRGVAEQLLASHPRLVSRRRRRCERSSQASYCARSPAAPESASGGR
jgi:hypothetical protein